MESEKQEFGEGLYERLSADFHSDGLDYKNIMKIERHLDSSLEQMVNRDSIKDILNDVSGIFRSVGDFVHSEINVFAYPVRDFTGLSYAEFSAKKLSDIIDSSVSRFSPEELALLEKDIKQTSYLLIKDKGIVYVKDVNDADDVRKIFKPVHSSYSGEEAEAEIIDKAAKASSLGIKAHLSVLLHSYKLDKKRKRKLPIGYFHLTKKTEFSDFDFWLVNRIVTHSAAIIDGYLFNLQERKKEKERIDALTEDAFKHYL